MKPVYNLITKTAQGKHEKWSVDFIGRMSSCRGSIGTGFNDKTIFKEGEGGGRMWYLKTDGHESLYYKDLFSCFP